MTREEDIQLDIISAYIGSPLTTEQKEFASNFNRDIISFSDPGTGKTHTLVAGLCMAQKHHGIDGNNINCMSFTNAAVNEMSIRYQKLCDKLSIASTVTFNTFHSLSRRILKSAYPFIEIGGDDNKKEIYKDMAGYLKKYGIEIEDNRYVRKVVKAVNNLNSALSFHPENVQRSYDFVELDMDIDIFQQIRKEWFLRGITSRVISQGDIPLYCLYALMKKPDLIKLWKGRYPIMVVDEFQDLSLLHLRILSYIADKLIVIGDMKQQIYAYNGACPQIVREYKKLHPNAVECNLTKSFRCSDKISEFATALILPNDRTIKKFTGHNRESHIQIIPRKDLNWEQIAQSILDDQKTNGFANARNVMFVYRNNASAIPIIDQLYQKNIPFRCTKFMQVMNLPMFKSLTKLANAAWCPDNLDFVKQAVMLFPEYSNSKEYITEPPIINVMRKTHTDLFNCKYRFREKSSYDIIEAMVTAKKAIEDNKSAGVVYMKLMTVYNKYIYPNEWWELDNTKEFYFGLVAPVVNSKPYPRMIEEEKHKLKKNEYSIQVNMGIRCYTMHAAKGLEADDIYILDCDEGMFPNATIMDKKLKSGCSYSVSVDVRSERNLLYVACTRAKENLYISYSGDEPSRLLTKPDSPKYTKYDYIYNMNNSEYDDALEFFKLFNIEEGNSNE